MISDSGKGERYVARQAQRSGDDRGAEAGGSRPQGRRCGTRGGCQQKHHLRMESQVWRAGGERSPEAAPVGRRERAVEETGGGSEPGPGDAESGDRKKRAELVTEGRTPAGCGSTTQSASAGFAGCCRWRSAVIAISRARTTMSYASGWCSWRGRSRASAIGACKCCCGVAVRWRTTSGYTGCIERPVYACDGRSESTVYVPVPRYGSTRRPTRNGPWTLRMMCWLQGERSGCWAWWM